MKISFRISIDNQTKPLLSYNDIQSRSVLLSWRVSNGRYDRFNHFIIYYRRLQNSDENEKEENEIINIQDYKQVLVDPRTIHYSFTFRVKRKKFFFVSFIFWFLFR
jgi:hypothetical protein